MMVRAQKLRSIFKDLTEACSKQCSENDNLLYVLKITVIVMIQR